MQDLQSAVLQPIFQGKSLRLGHIPSQAVHWGPQSAARNICQMLAGFWEVKQFLNT